jgi:hypothetical protein
MSIKERAEVVSADLLELTNEMVAMIHYLAGDEIATNWQAHVAVFTEQLVSLAATVDEKADDQ